MLHSPCHWKSALWERGSNCVPGKFDKHVSVQDRRSVKVVEAAGQHQVEEIFFEQEPFDDIEKLGKLEESLCCWFHREWRSMRVAVEERDGCEGCKTAYSTT